MFLYFFFKKNSLGTAVAFTYLWHITFFGACIALAGYAEKQNRHAMTCLKVLPKSKSGLQLCIFDEMRIYHFFPGQKGILYRLFCSGGVNPDDPCNPLDNSDNMVMVFFRDYIGGALNNSKIKSLVLFLFVCYMFVSILGIISVKEGLERKKLARFDSYSVQFYELEDNFFREYPYRISVKKKRKRNKQKTQK